ncbi:hypothetical protein [uncultured Slackia sp.]|uniref:hypothetical protein n=1 Tax=uncultured Slackia sp. TaxID=665903 RepID=UPI0025E49988|nr:hypothetical protein [uncultured Slackia sp.]
MVLNPTQGIRFFQLLDSMVDFANARLGLNLRVGRDRARRDPEKQSEVMRALCAHPEVLQEYDLNPPTEFSGVHRRPLADIPFEERDARIEEEAWRILENFEGGALTIEKALRKNCVKGERQIVRRHRPPCAADVSQARVFRPICMVAPMRTHSKHAFHPHGKVFKR